MDGAVSTAHNADASPLAPGESPTRLATILHVQWALAIACSYLVLFGQESGDPHGFGPLIVVGFLATNLVVGRLPAAAAQRAAFGFVLGAVDTALIVASLYVAGQLSLELVLLCLGILILAIAGLHIGAIAIATVAFTGVYLGIVWLAGDTTLWRSSVLLRVPLLFSAAIVYAWLVELGSRGAAAREALRRVDPAATVADEAAAQRDAIERCGAALRGAALEEAGRALQDVAARNDAIRAAAACLTR